MAKRKFKAESKKLLDMMINSIYTHKEIFLRELISNASDAIDKQYYRALGDENVNVKREDFAIWLEADKDSRTLKITDNGIGMDREQAERILTQESKGYGVRNVNERIKLFYGEKYALKIESEVGEGTTVYVRFPRT